MAAFKSATGPFMPKSRPGRAAGTDLGSNATISYAISCWITSSAVGRQNRYRDGSPVKRTRLSSATKASTASSTLSSAVRTIAPGATIYPEPSVIAAIAAANRAHPPASSRTASQSPNGQKPSVTGALQDIGKPISCSSVPMDRPSSSHTSVNPASSCSPDNPAKPRHLPQSNSRHGSGFCHPDCEKPSPSTTEPSSPSTTNLHSSSASRPSSAILIAPGKKAESKTPSDACDDRCREKLISLPSIQKHSTPASQPITIHRENASASDHQQRSSQNCCTSNVNPPARLRGNDEEEQFV